MDSKCIWCGGVVRKANRVPVLSTPVTLLFLDGRSAVGDIHYACLTNSRVSERLYVPGHYIVIEMPERPSCRLFGKRFFEPFDSLLEFMQFWEDLRTRIGGKNS